MQHHFTCLAVPGSIIPIGGRPRARWGAATLVVFKGAGFDSSSGCVTFGDSLTSRPRFPGRDTQRRSSVLASCPHAPQSSRHPPPHQTAPSSRRKHHFHVQPILDEVHETRDLYLVVLSRRAVNDFDFHSVLRSAFHIFDFPATFNPPSSSPTVPACLSYSSVLGVGCQLSTVNAPRVDCGCPILAGLVHARVVLSFSCLFNPRVFGPSVARSLLPTYTKQRTCCLFLLNLTDNVPFQPH